MHLLKIFVLYQYLLMHANIKIECQKACINSFIDSKNGWPTKSLWSFIKNKKKDQCSIPPIQINDMTVTDSYEKSIVLNDYFTSNFTQEDLTSLPKVPPFLKYQVLQFL